MHKVIALVLITMVGLSGIDFAITGDIVYENNMWDRLVFYPLDCVLVSYAMWKIWVK